MPFAMQAIKPKVPLTLKSDETKRTTIILERSEREYIEQLIKDGKEPGIKPLISKMLDIYKSLNIDDWQFPGEYYCGISRIAVINVEMINIFTQYIPKEKLHELGTRMGDALKVSIQSTIGLDPSKKDNWAAVFRRLSVQGLGDFYLRDKFLLLKTPVINECEIWRGLLEGLLGIELETRNSMAPLVFEIKQTKTAT
ncbi:MAG TPA: hypothetical protein VLH35_06715, partial [Candidatus Acidoferrales bacterium]|nr:hypothetical protein [Candidatus Acidoferrales bacterium]